MSRHLGLLKDAGLIVEQREGGFTYFRPSPSLLGGENGSGPLAALLQAEFAEAARTETGRADDARLAEVRRLRKENFDAHAGPGHATNVSSSPAAAGRRGRARSGTSCRRCASPTSAAARAI